MRPVQYFSQEYLKSCEAFTVEQIVAFVEDFRDFFGEAANQKKLLNQEKIFLELKIPISFTD